MYLRYQKDPRVTLDRSIPEWFQESLRLIDPHLKADWWNEHPIQGPTFQLLRVLPDKRYSHIEWFRTEDEMRLILGMLRKGDTHRRGVEQHEALIQAYQEKVAEVRADRETFNRRIEAASHETGENILRSQDPRWRGHEKTMHSIPGVRVRKDWNA